MRLPTPLERAVLRNAAVQFCGTYFVGLALLSGLLVLWSVKW